MKVYVHVRLDCYKTIELDHLSPETTYDEIRDIAWNEAYAAFDGSIQDIELEIVEEDE
jgi:hypothetical protein